MTDRKRVQLLSGPYTLPRLKRGDRSTCLVRRLHGGHHQLERRPHPVAALPRPGSARGRRLRPARGRGAGAGRPQRVRGGRDVLVGGGGPRGLALAQGPRP